MRDDEWEDSGDPLRTARGIAWGLVIGSIMWAAIITGFVLWLAN